MIPIGDCRAISRKALGGDVATCGYRMGRVREGTLPNSYLWDITEAMDEFASLLASHKNLLITVLRVVAERRLIIDRRDLACIIGRGKGHQTQIAPGATVNVVDSCDVDIGTVCIYLADIFWLPTSRPSWNLHSKVIARAKTSIIAPRTSQERREGQSMGEGHRRVPGGRINRDRVFSFPHYPWHFIVSVDEQICTSHSEAP